MSSSTMDARGFASRCCSVGTVLSAAACGTLAVAIALAGPSAAEAVGGEAVVVSPQDGSPTAGTPLAEGDATTPFSLKLPSGAACSGDSTEGGYRVQSFMVHEGVDPAGLTFGPLGPLPKGVSQDFRQPLYAVNTTAFANAATNLANAPGGEGTIINVPTFSLGLFKAGELHPGGYTIGIACTKGPASPAQLDRYWAAEVVLAAGADPSALPGWTASVSTKVDEPSAALDTSSPATTTTASATPDQAAAGSDGAEAVDTAQPTPEQPSAPVSGATGAPPSFQIPAASLVSSLSIAGGPVRSLLIWAAIAILLARATYLLARRPVLASA